MNVCTLHLPELRHERAGPALGRSGLDTEGRQLYLKYLAVKFKDLWRGFDVQAGRFAYASGAEASSFVPGIEAVKRLRIVGISTFGASLVSSLPSGDDALDALLWLAGQTGRWYEDAHRAWALAAEAGYQWPRAAWEPWIRGGINVASGDRAPSDSSHHTFFPMLPTARKYSLSTVYAPMNLRDAFVQVIARPTARTSLRVDLHGVRLVSVRDRWYFGSGATQRSGASFGYGGRDAGTGGTGLGTVLEGSIDLTITPHWSVNAYAGLIRGGDVVRASFAGDVLSFSYLEAVVQF